MTTSRTCVLILATVSLASLVGCTTTTSSGTTTPHAVNTVTTTSYNRQLGKRIPISTFSPEDTVACLVDFAWSDVTRPAGDHLVQWRWYRDGTLVSQAEKKMTFATSPYTTWTTRAASSLGPGQYKVETLLDGQPASLYCEFQIKPQHP